MLFHEKYDKKEKSNFTVRLGHFHLMIFITFDVGFFELPKELKWHLPLTLLKEDEIVHYFQGEKASTPNSTLVFDSSRNS